MPGDNGRVHPVDDQQRLIGGRYRLSVQLGSGAMGTVWSGYDEVLRRRVAVKELKVPPGVPQREAMAMRERMLREARALGGLSHPNVITVYDVVDVQILSRPAGPPAPAISPPAAENASMRVYRYELGPGVASAQHTHARPYVILAATNADLRMTSPDGASMDHAVKAGDIHWVDSAVTHTLANRGSDKAILVEIELK